MLDQQAIQVKAPYFAYEAGGRRINIRWDEVVGDVYVGNDLIGCLYRNHDHDGWEWEYGGFPMSQLLSRTIEHGTGRGRTPIKDCLAQLINVWDADDA